jgi:hypothetical protein
MMRGEIRAANNSIDFIDRTYRKRDPTYADFSIRHQQHLLERLSKEWTRSECGPLPPIDARKIRVFPHPGALVEPRLKLKICERIRAEILATNNSIAFIQKTYQEKDPEYADFSIRTQRHHLERLSDEWASLECGEASPAPDKKRRVRKSSVPSAD